MGFCLEEGKGKEIDKEDGKKMEGRLCEMWNVYMQL